MLQICIYCGFHHIDSPQSLYICKHAGCISVQNLFFSGHKKVLAGFARVMKADVLSKEIAPKFIGAFLVGEDGFGPSKLKSNRFTVCPLWPLGNSPNYRFCITRMQNNGAGGRTRTPDLLITNQLLYQLSYTSA